MTKTTKPRTKRLKVSKPIVTPEVDPEVSADEAMVMDHAPFTDSLKRISEQAKDWEDTALSPRGPKPYEWAGRKQNLMLARATVVMGIVLFAAILLNVIYFSFEVRTLNRSLTALTLENKKLKEEVAAVAMIKLAQVEKPVPPPAASAPAMNTAPVAKPVAVQPKAQAKPTTTPSKPVAAQPKMAKAKAPPTAFKSDFE